MLNLAIEFIFSNSFRRLFGFMVQSCLGIHLDWKSPCENHMWCFFHCSETAWKQDVYSPPHLRRPKSSRPRFCQGNRCLHYTYRESYRCRWESYSSMKNENNTILNLNYTLCKLCQCSSFNIEVCFYHVSIMSDCLSIFQAFLCFILVLYFSVSFPISLHLAAIVCNRVL